MRQTCRDLNYEHRLAIQLRQLRPRQDQGRFAAQPARERLFPGCFRISNTFDHRALRVNPNEHLAAPGICQSRKRLGETCYRGGFGLESEGITLPLSEKVGDVKSVHQVQVERDVARVSESEVRVLADAVVKR